VVIGSPRDAVAWLKSSDSRAFLYVILIATKDLARSGARHPTNLGDAKPHAGFAFPLGRCGATRLLEVGLAEAVAAL
jgi:hypothetical protein